MNNPSGPVQAIIGGTVIDGTGGPPVKNSVILIEGARIVAVGDLSMAVPPHAAKVSAVGKYIIPGLMDANVHLYFEHTPAELGRGVERYEEIIARGAQRALRNGLTTLFDTWGPRDSLAHVRDRIQRGEVVGSRVFFAGNIVGLGGPTSPDFYPATRSAFSKEDAQTIDLRWEQGVGADLLWCTPQEVRARVRKYITGGQQNFLKYASSSHSQMQFLCFSLDLQRVIVEEAHRGGLTAQAHTTSPESLRLEIEAGADLLQHADLTGLAGIPEETLSVIAKRRIPCAALFVTRRFLAWTEAHMPDLVKTVYRIKDENDRRLVSAGAEVLLTTDSVNMPADATQNPLIGPAAEAEESPFALGEGHFLWLQAAVELGMAPMDVLLAATRNVARAYKVDEELGTITPGKIADLLILDADPLTDPRHYRRIHQVMKAGAFLGREQGPGAPTN